MLRPGLFGRPCRGMCAQPVKGDPSAAETGRMRLKVKCGRWSRVLYSSAQSVFFEHFEAFSEHGIFHGITI